MRRITKKYLALANSATFASLLLVILYLNLSPSPSNRAFDWATVRYHTTANTLPEARGKCPGLAGSSKPALVVAKVIADGDSAWLDALSGKYHVCSYLADAPRDETSSTGQTPANRGNEAMAYLTWMIDNYDDIPAAGSVFVHGSRWAWHNDAPDYDNAALLISLNTTTALEPYGYHNLRCDWSASTCSPKEAPPQGSLETIFKAKMQPWDARAVSDAALPGALQTLFHDDATGSTTALGRSEAIRSQCCAQFIVSQTRLWQHSRAEYVALRQWLLDSGEKAAPADAKVAGRILSYIWHILFMQDADSTINLDRLNAQACPTAQECYCRLYGRCNLRNCDRPGRCQGQYVIPPDYRLPKDWESSHQAIL
ncbi:hypothetical protein DOTSEDRAFT_71833 [Dothistroma septosporum NZE10]|uniref:Uncharacterized protein n=1 Tax=Dothistroma septosporum (strain NZE10 / CBS 128990) TaxID=675120 RepID=N1PNY1_DOTSN|nr:hypothetical protein DOTSEDRAFT_71833 [Dothistroma septosporum NZE10]